jgi:GNAT superfamily N-acetyltransferase
LGAIERAAGERYRAIGMPAIADVAEEELFAAAPIAAALVQEGSVWVAADGARLAGFLGAAQADGCGFILELGVLPSHAGQGLGRQLISACEAWARQAGLRALTLATFRHVPWNAPYYARMGFQECAPDRLGPAHMRSWAAQARTLDMSQRLFMERPLA